MATEDNLRERAKEIRGAFLPESVTNEAVGGLLLDIINFILSRGGSGGEGGKPDARYWNKEELTVLDQYLYVLGDKIKALYADNAGDSELFEGHSWKDYFDQPLRTFDPVKFKSVTHTDDVWHITENGDAKLRDILGRIITISGGLMTDDFIAGMTGAGTGIVNKSELHTDRGVFRKYIEVLALVVSKMYWRGGRQCLSPAGMKVSKVEEYTDYWRCYMETEDGQTNEFTIGAQARCNNYGNGTQKYYWRLVVGIGDDYIDLSKTDCDNNSGTPSVGDDVVQFGHRTDPYLQWVVMDSSFSDDAGRTIYAGVNSYDLSGKMVLRIGVSPTDPTRIGLFTRHGEFSDVIDGINQDIQDNQQAIQDTKDAADAIQTILDNLTGIIIPDMKNQLDGAIQSWDGTVEPTLNNYPANEWTTDAEKSKHVGDTYIYYMQDSEGNTVSSRYNFRFVDGVYKWELIADSVSAELEVKLRELTGTVGKKNSITYSNNVPTPAYNIDDLWIKEDGSMYICRAQKLDGMQGSAADWELFNDTMLRLAKMADDGIISKEEKATLRDTWNQIQKEFISYQAQATKYGVSITALQNAYNTLNTFLTNTVKLSQNVDTSLTVAQKTEYNQDFANYYSEVTAFSSLISQKINDESIGNLQIGMVNMLKGSNVELNAQGYNMGRYYFERKLEVGKEYTFVICYTLGANNTSVNAYQDSGYVTLGVFRKQGNKVIESRTFTYTSTRDDGYIGIYQLPNGTYGSTVHWAVLVEGNKAPNSWIPALSEQGQEAAKDAVDNLQIGSVNLISRKMMLAWNEKNKDIAVWGQDSDGVYLNVNPIPLRNYISEGTNYKDVFLGEGNYKPNTQYVFSIEWKTATTEENRKNGLYLYVIYTDGSYELFFEANNQQTSKKRSDYITTKGKTIQKISSGYGYNINCLIYSIGLIEGNKIPADIPVATEDLTGQSNVNLVDRGKELTVTAGASSNTYFKTLVIPKLKPNTVYYLSFKAENLVGTPTEYKAEIRNTNVNAEYAGLLSVSGGILITTNNFADGEGRLCLFAGKYGSTAGNSVKFTEVMLVEGFTPPSSYSPSPGDVQKEIDDVSDAVTSLNTTINTTFKDGIISEAEAKAIASNINVLNAEKADIDAYYNKLYANTYLTGTAKTNLSSAKTAYNTAHTNLISSINTAIADGKTTAAEKADVDAKFATYNTALSTYQTRVGEADKAIQDRIKVLAEQDATNKIDGIQIGGTNLFPISRLNTVGYRGNSSKEGYGTEIIFKCNAPQAWAIIPVSIPTPVVPTNTDFIISMDIRNTNGFGFEVTATSGTPTIFDKINFENTTSTWKRISKRYNSGDKNNIGGINLWGVGDVRHIKIEIGNKATDWSPAPEDIDQAIQNAIAKMVDITAPSQVFKYGAGYTGTPTPASIVLTAIPKNFTPTSYQWQYLNGSTWTNISGATSSTYSVVPGNTTLFPSGVYTRTFRCVCNGDERLSDNFTLAKLADGATGATGAAGKDAYTILLTNESHAFAGSVSAAIAGSTSCAVAAYKGATQVAATIGSITGLPAGMTASIANNGTTTATITFTVTTSMKTASGTVNIPITVDGKSFTRVFSYSIAFKGATGQTGAQGIPGESINGKILYKDPEFKLGMNGVARYSNAPDDILAKLTLERITKPSDAPTQSGYCLKVTCKAAQSPGYGGVYQSITSRANAVFIQKIIAKLPVGYKINATSNSMGTGYTDTWLTPTEGTGKYTTYLRKVVCGASGTFSTGGHVYITGNPAPSESVPLEWYIASMTCFDQTADGYADVEITTKDSLAVQLGFTNFEALKANAFKKGFVKTGLIEADVIDVNTLAGKTVFAEKLLTNQAFMNSIKANTLAVGGFTIQDYQIIGGADYGAGAGIKITSTDTERSFKAYKDASHYVEMFYRSASDWGLKGVDGSPVFQLGSTNKIGPFTIEKEVLNAKNPYVLDSGYEYDGGLILAKNHIYFKYAMRSIYQQSAYLGVKGGAGSSYGTNSILVVEGGDMWHQAGLFYAADIRLRGDMNVDTGSIINMTNGSSLILGVRNVSVNGTDPSITIRPRDSNFLTLNGNGDRKKIYLTGAFEIGSWFIIMSYQSQGFDVFPPTGEYVWRNGTNYKAVQSGGEDPVLIVKVNTGDWLAGQLPVNWLGVWK